MIDKPATETIQLLKKLVQFNTENPPGTTIDALLFLKDWALDQGLKATLKIYDEDLGKGNILISTDEIHQDEIMMSGHLDVVKAGDLKKWIYDPFSATEENGYIFGRGSADMKAGVAAALEGGAQLLQNKAANDSMKSALALGYVSTNKNFLTKTTGAIQNPNLELLFDSPSLRQFSFTFVMSAREDKESQAIRRIIRFFKQGMSVQRASTGLFLKSPNTFDIKYKYKSNDHPYLNKIKECALINFSVDYTPAGNYSTYEDGAMTLYALSMQFQELDPIYNDDYDNKLGKESIGY